MGRAYITHGNKRNACRTLVGKPEGKRPLGKPRRLWELIVKWILYKQDWTGLMWLRIGTNGGLLRTR
jgi:hypothetical protein